MPFFDGLRPYMPETDVQGYPDYGFGRRLDGTFKGPGFAQGIASDGSVVTEWSAGPPDMQYPLMYEGIASNPVHYRAVVDDASGRPVSSATMQEVYHSALDAAIRRALGGKPAFWHPDFDGPSVMSYEDIYRVE